jgi:hypothetical protein
MESRFRTGYLEQFPGYYFQVTGYKDKDDYIYITGRSMMLSILQLFRTSALSTTEIGRSYHPIFKDVRIQ